MLGTLYFQWRKFDQAVPLLEEGLAAFKVSEGENHPHTVFVRHRLPGPTSRREARTRPATLRARLAQCKEKPPLIHAEAANSLGLARAYLAAKMPEKAERAPREGLDVRVKSEPDDWRTFEARSLLGRRC